MSLNARAVAAKLVLPPQTTWATLYSAASGAMAAATDAGSRNAFEELVDDGIIQDTVLQNSPSGSILIFGLFDQLHQNPLLRKHLGEGFAAEFCQALAPALTNFHDILYQLQQKQEENFVERQKEKENEKSASSPEDTAALLFKAHLAMSGDILGSDDDEDNALESILGPPAWKNQAEQDPDSLEAAFAQMTTPEFFNSLYYSTELALLTRRQFQFSMGETTFDNQTNTTTLQFQPQQPLLQGVQQHYQVGSAKIGQVAVLRARAMELDNNATNHQYREFDASSDPDFENKRVAAQWDILFEVTSRFQETFPTTLEEEQERSSSSADNTDSAITPPSHANDKLVRTEEVEYTRLGVAILEGYIHRNPNAKDGGSLRWRVPLIRDPYEFDISDPSTSVSRTVLSTSTAPSTGTKEEEASSGEESNSKTG